MPKQHILPAAYLGGFSTSEDRRLRQRPVWVARREGQVFRRAAETLARRPDHYTLEVPVTIGEEGPSLIVDELWSGAEAALHEVLDGLTEAATTGVMRLRSWLLAVDLLSQFFIRAPAYDEKQQADSDTHGLDLTRDEINGSRLLNLQALRPALLHANWAVVRAPNGELVTNDCGYMHVNETVTGTHGCAFALRRDLAVLLFPSTEDRSILKDDDWLGVTIRRGHDLSADEVTAFNRTMAAHRPAIFGPTEEVISRARLGFSDGEVLPLGAEPLIPEEGAHPMHGIEWLNLLSAAGLDLPRGTVVAYPVGEVPGRLNRLRRLLRLSR